MKTDDKISIIVVSIIISLGILVYVGSNSLGNYIWDNKLNDWNEKELEKLSCEIVFKKLNGTPYSDTSYDGKIIKVFNTIKATWYELGCDDSNSTNWKGNAWIYTQSEDEQRQELINRVEKSNG